MNSVDRLCDLEFTGFIGTRPCGSEDWLIEVTSAVVIQSNVLLCAEHISRYTSMVPVCTGYNPYTCLMHVLSASMDSQTTLKFRNFSNIPWLPLWKSASKTTLGHQKCWSKVPFGFTQILPEQTHPKNSKNTWQKMENRNAVTTKEETSLKSPLCIHKRAWTWMNP